MKYSQPNRLIRVIQGEETNLRCYLDNLRLKMMIMVVAHVQHLDMQEVNVLDLNL